MVSRHVVFLVVVAALLAALLVVVGDSRSLSLGVGAGAAGLLVLGGVIAMALRMPPLPALDVAEPSPLEDRMRAALSQDVLSRSSVLDSVGVIRGRVLTDGERQPLLGLPPREFESWLRAELDRLAVEV
jgi:hypothetical protein